METVELACETRATSPKSVRNELRRNARVPAVLYGPRTKPTPVSIDALQLKARVAAAARQRIIRLKSASSEIDGKYIIFREIQRGPISGEILHADLYEVDLQQRIRVQVPLRFTGKAAGIALGGILQPLVRAVDVECLPLEIPEAIDVDVTELGIHDVIHISAVQFAGNVKPIYDTDYAVVSVLPPTVEVAPVAAAPEAAVVEGAPVEGAAAAPAEGAKEGAPAAAAPAPAAGGEKRSEAPARK
jgi:large subunit ribosomal protein L25